MYVIYMVFTTEGFFEVAIESWPEWDLNHDHWIQASGHECKSHSEPTFYSYSNFIIRSVSDFILAIAFISRHAYFNRNFIEVIIWL